MAKLSSVKLGLGSVNTNTVACMPKQTDSHYGSQGHKDWAKAVIEKAGGKCQWVGCAKTSKDGRLYADHIVERKDGGAPLDPANGQALCGKHHSIKTAKERKARYAR